MLNKIDYQQADLTSEKLDNNKTSEMIQSVPIYDDVFDFIGDWILKDFLEHEGG